MPNFDIFLCEVAKYKKTTASNSSNEFYNTSEKVIPITSNFGFRSNMRPDEHKRKKNEQYKKKHGLKPGKAQGKPAEHAQSRKQPPTQAPPPVLKTVKHSDSDEVFYEQNETWMSV